MSSPSPDASRFAGRDAIRAFLGDTAASLAGGGAPKRLFHHVASHTITVRDRTTASGAAYFLVVTAAGPDHWGRYGDRYIARDGLWLFAERRVRVEGLRWAFAAPEHRALRQAFFLTPSLRVSYGPPSYAPPI